MCEVMRHPWGLEGEEGVTGHSLTEVVDQVVVGVQLDQCFTPYSCTWDLREPRLGRRMTSTGLVGTGTVSWAPRLASRGTLALSNHPA